MAILASAWLVHALIVSRSTDLVASDDAFISFQYARNLAHGNGLVFNLGERVWGFTSPLQTLLLALATAAGLDTVRAAFGLGFVSVAAAALLLFRLGARVLWQPFALAVAAFFLADPSQHGTYALESNLLVALQLAFLLAAARGFPRLAIALAALSCLARPDSLLLVLPILLACRACRRPGYLAWFFLVGAAWESFAFFYYGALLPQSFHAKAGLTPFVPFLGGALRSVSSGGVAAVLGVGADSGFGVRIPVLLLSLLPLASSRVRRHLVFWYSLVVYPWVLIAAYSWIGSYAGHNWEFYSAKCMAGAAAGIGILSIVEGALKRRVAGTSVRWGVAASVLVLAAAGVAIHGGGLERRLAVAQDWYWGGQRYNAMRRVADWMTANTPADASIAAGEVGTLAYFSNRTVIDTSGIVTRGYLPDERMRLLPFLRRFRPDYALAYYRTEAAVPAPGLLYRTVHVFPNEGYRDVWLLARED